MQKIIEETTIKASQVVIWNFLVNLDKKDNYKKWHPQDHIKLIPLKGSLDKIGSIYYCEEKLGKFTLKIYFKVDKSIYLKYLEYSAAFPLSLLKAGRIYFKIKAFDKDTTKLIAYSEYGYDLPVLGLIVDKIIALFINKKDCVRHVQEEGENIKNILEARLSR